MEPLLHVVHSKTGTFAFQKHMISNYDLLLQKGFLYLKSITMDGCHNAVSISISDSSGHERTELSLSDFISSLANDIEVVRKMVFA